MHVRVVDDNQHPLSGVDVFPRSLQRPRKGKPFNNPGVRGLMAVTDDNGTALLDTVPSDNVGTVSVAADAANYRMRQRLPFAAPDKNAEGTIVLVPLVTVRGHVARADGRPAAAAVVHASGVGYQMIGQFSEIATCNADGDFEMRADPDIYCVFVALDDESASRAERRVVRSRLPFEPVQLVLQPASRISGRLTVGSDRKPLIEQSVSLYLRDEGDYRKLPEKDQLSKPAGPARSIDPSLVRWTKTDAEGRYTFLAGPGHYFVVGPRNVAPAQFEITQPAKLEADLHAERPEHGEIHGRVVLKSDPQQGVAEIPIAGSSIVPRQIGRLKAVSDSQGKFTATRELLDMLVQAETADGLLATVVLISADDREVSIPLGPTASAHGRLVDGTTGQPLADRQIETAVRAAAKDGPEKSFRLNSRSTRTNVLGEFAVGGLAPGWNYELRCVTALGADGAARQWQVIASAAPEKAELIELGDVKLPAPPRPLSVDEFIVRSMPSSPLPQERLAARLADARMEERPVLLLVTPRGCAACRRFFEFYLGLTDVPQIVRDALAAYVFVPVDTTEGEPQDAARPLLESLQLPLPSAEDALFAILDQEGRQIARFSARELMSESELSAVKLAGILKRHMSAYPNAEKLLADALAQARREDKYVFVRQSAASCGPCLLWSRYLSRHRDLFAKDYVSLKLDMCYRNCGTVIDRIRGKQGGVPWIAILDASGKLLATSDGPEGNFGFPAKPSEVADFVKMLRATARRMTDDDLASLVKGFSATGQLPKSD
ncbi:MAG TPA: thioredoxin family protein [Planctomycetaceae bacterium]|nr:thioredoxin family protein [Planctomycetaceae bacterium]